MLELGFCARQPRYRKQGSATGTNLPMVGLTDPYLVEGTELLGLLCGRQI
jgi:hypothetical protein